MEWLGKAHLGRQSAELMDKWHSLCNLGCWRGTHLLCQGCLQINRLLTAQIHQLAWPLA